MKTVILAEKPNVANDFARVLNCGQKKKGYFENNHLIITWSLGHLITLADPDFYDKKYKEWKLETLPMIPDKLMLKVIKQTSHQFNTIRQILGRNDIKELVIATDAGREGELVARWIMKLAGYKGQTKRLWISSQTDGAIRQGFAELKPGNAYVNLFHAAECRSEADWLIGLNATRALTCKHNSRLSAGRVQTPTLAMIVNRENEIKQFKPTPYWKIEADFKQFRATWKHPVHGERIFDYQQAQQIQASLANQPAKIIAIRREKKSAPPPHNYDLISLQRDGNIRFGFSAQKTLQIMQSLYDHHKLITYPRTDSKYLTSDMAGTLADRLKALSVSSYKSIIAPLLQKPLQIGKNIINNAGVSDHHAVIPTEQSLASAQLTSDEKKIHELIVRRFAASLYPPYTFEKIYIDIAIGNESFYATGILTIQSGWREILQPSGDDTMANAGQIPRDFLQTHQSGQSLPLIAIKVLEKQTQPPPRYTEATLLTAMENAGAFIKKKELSAMIKKSGIGTAATRAEIIEKLFTNYYMEKIGKEIRPTSKGQQLINLVPDMLRSPELTAKWESRLTKITEGAEKPADFMNDIKKNTIDVVNQIKNDTASFKVDNLTAHVCPVCGKKMLSVREKNGKALICSDLSCNYKQLEQDDRPERDIYKKSRQESKMNKVLISKFSDHNKSSGLNLGNLLESAIKEKKTDKKK